MTAITKYKSKPLFFDPVDRKPYSPTDIQNLPLKQQGRLIRFASTHEWRVYEALLDLFPSNLIAIQPKIQVVPPNQLMCFPNGRNWKADFCVITCDKTEIIVEAKGVITKDFALTLPLLETYNKQAFDKLWLVFSQKIPNNQILNNLCKTSMLRRVTTLSKMRQSMTCLSTR